MPVNIVLMSEGMFVARDRDNMTTLGRLAAEARATIHIIRPSQQFFDIEDRAAGGSASRFFDDGLMSEGLEQVAAQTRGSMSVVNGDGQIAFDRLGRNLPQMRPARNAITPQWALLTPRFQPGHMAGPSGCDSIAPGGVSCRYPEPARRDTDRGRRAMSTEGGTFGRKITIGEPSAFGRKVVTSI